MANDIISSLGAGSGIDSQSLVSSLIAAERQPIDLRLETKQTKLEAQISAYGAMKSALSQFQGILKPLQDPATFNARGVSFTETNTLTPSKIESDAITGNYQVEVQQLARVQSLSTATLADTKTAVGTGTINLRFGTWSDPSFTANTAKDGLQITIDESNNTLEGIRDAINKTDSGVQASIIQDSGSYRLLIASPTGEANALEISVDEDPAAPGLSMLNYNETFQTLTQNQAAQDAAIEVNGLLVHRDSNEIKDLISGLEFTINKASPGEIINFSITEDKQTGEQAVRDFVEAYNELFKFSKDITGVSTDENNQSIKGDLATDSIAKSINSRLKEVLSSAVPGVQGNFSSLATLGIQTNRDGTLAIEETGFKAAIETNYEVFSSLFSPQRNSDNALITAESGSRFAETKPGIYDLVITNSAAKGKLEGAAITYDFTQSLDTGTDDYSFKISINEVESGLIQLPQNKVYASEIDILSDMQSLINSDSALSGVKAEVNVSLEGGKFVFTSREYGSSSKVAISATSANFASLGIQDGSGISGQDVAGTINGEAGFGSGNILLPTLGTAASGMSFIVSPGASSAKVTVSQGLSGELNNLINNILGNDGAIKARENGLNREIDEVKKDKNTLDNRMASRLAQLQSQFLMMERITSSFAATGLQLEGMLSSLPFTRQN